LGKMIDKKYEENLNKKEIELYTSTMLALQLG
jgi:hypothetical protein